MKCDVVLASASPRRSELLKYIFKNFTVNVSSVEEVVPENFSVLEHPEYLAKIKAQAVAQRFPDSLVIGADTVVLLSNTILGKPKSKEEAKKMLSELSGKNHKVITGCAVIYRGTCHTFSVTTDVEFYELSEKEITDYIETDEPYDKAGGYGIQSAGALFVKKINGDYYNVVGFPIAELRRQIKNLAPDLIG